MKGSETAIARYRPTRLKLIWYESVCNLYLNVLLESDKDKLYLEIAQTTLCERVSKLKLFIRWSGGVIPLKKLTEPSTPERIRLKYRVLSQTQLHK